MQASELYKQLRSCATGHPLLKNADLLNLAAQARLRQVRRGEIFFRQGEPGTSALISGEVEGEIIKADSRRIGEFQLQVGALFGEMSLLNDARRLGRYNCYVYAGRLVSYMLPRGTFDGVVKYDLEQGTKQVHELGRARFCGEAVFVPRSDSSKEDQGWLLTYVHDAVLRRSELLLLDAEDLQADPVARILLPQRVPYGFHSTWVPCPRRC